MITLSEINKLYMLDSLTAPLPEGSRYHWIFNGQQLDFMLNEIEYLEEHVGPTLTLIIEGCEVRVPSSWHIMIVDRETYTVDMVPVNLAAVFDHDVMLFSPSDSKLQTAKAKIHEFEQKASSIYPSMDKAHALVYGIAPGISHMKTIPRGVIVGPSDLHRYINRKTVGDILT